MILFLDIVIMSVLSLCVAGVALALLLMFSD